MKCPSHQQLAELLNDTLSDAQRTHLEEHLGTCVRCQQVLAGAAVDDEHWPALQRDLREHVAAVSPLGVAGHVDSAAAPTPRPATDGQDTHPSLEDSDEQPRVPGYRILDELGRGGMGVVYKARQQSLHRTVALKLIHRDARTDPELRLRFQREAETIAKLQHPGIVQVYDVGEHNGHPYIACEYVPGKNLAQYMGGTPLSAEQSAHLLEAIAQGMAAVHACNIIHRDLKPANILLHDSSADAAETGELSKFVCKISDFGLAKDFEQAQHLTQTGHIVGTVSYMAPEQADGKANTLGPATDVYALGCILYEMLTGRPPFQGETALDTMKQTREQEPVPPRHLQPKTPLDLETICLKCIAKEPRQRYADAQALADDLQRFRTHQPIRARRIGTLGRLRRWARRRPAAAALSVVILIALVTMAIGSGSFTWQLQHAYAQLQQEQGLVLTANKKAKHERDNAIAKEQVAQRETRKANRTLAKLRVVAYSLQLMLAQREMDVGRFVAADKLLTKCARELRGWEYNLVATRCRRSLVTSLHSLDLSRSAGGRRVALSAAGSHLAHVASKDVKRFDPMVGRERSLSTPFVTLWDWRRKQILWQQAIPFRGSVQEVQFNRKGTLLAVLLANPARLPRLRLNAAQIHVYDVRRGAKVGEFSMQGQRRGMDLDFCPDGKHIAATDGHGTMQVFDIGKGPTITHRWPKWSRHIAYSPDGKHLASGCYSSMSAKPRDLQITLWDATTGKRKLRFDVLAPLTSDQSGDITQLAFHPDGQWLAALVRMGKQHTVCVHDVASGRIVARRRESRPVTFLHVLTDPQTAANEIAYFVGTHLVLWDWRPDTVRYHKGHDIATRWSVDPKQGLLCSLDNSDRITVWNMQASREKRWLPDAGGYRTLACLSLDGKHLALRTRAAAMGKVRGPTIDIWNLQTGQRRSLATTSGHPLAFHPEGRQLLVGSNLYNIDDGKKHAEVVDLENRRVRQAMFSTDGKRLYLRLSNGDTAVWDAGTRKLSRQQFKLPDCEVLPQLNGRYAVVMDPAFNLRVHDDRTGRLLHQIWEHGLHVPNAPNPDDTGRELNAAVVSPDGVYLANSLSLQDGAIHKLRLWHLPTGKLILDVPTQRAQRPAFSPDGKRFLFFSDIGQINIWDLATRQSMFRLRAFTAVTRSTGSTDQLIAHPKRLVAVSADHGVTVWDRDR